MWMFMHCRIASRRGVRQHEQTAEGEQTMKTHTAPDGYIRKKQKELRRARQTIAAKYAATLVIILLLPVWLFGLAANPGPDAWEETEVQYQSISEEYVGFPTRLRHVLHTSDGRMFVFNERIASMEEIQKSITAQETLYARLFRNDLRRENHRGPVERP